MPSAVKVITTTIICAGIIGAGATIAWAGARYREEAKAAELANLKTEKRVPNVKVLALKAQVVEDALYVTGSLEAWDDRTIGAEVGGALEWRGVEEGDSVKAGQELLRVDTDAIRAQVDEITAQEKWARQEFERAKSLSTRGAMGERDKQQAEAQLDIASAGLRARTVMLEKSVVKAPMDGIVDTVYSKKGEFVEAGRPLIRIVQTDRMKAMIGIPERDISYFKVGDVVRLRVAASDDQEFTGTIHRIATSADLVTRTFQTEVEVPNADGLLKPGMILRATLVRKAYPDSLLVPIFSIISLENQRLAFVEKDGIVEARPIEIGVLVGSSVQVTKGLAPGDHLIVVGQRDLQPGITVNVKEVLE